jgi:hypothetical protein
MYWHLPYNNLAGAQQAQGKYALAEAGCGKALAILRKVLGEQHPDTATSYYNLATNQQAQGKYARAEELATRAADIFGRTRLRLAATGLERASFTGKRSPLPLLAALLARNGKPALAWQRLEESLGRGTGDDLAARRKRPAAERQRQSLLLARLRLLEAQLHKLAAVKEPTQEQNKQRQRLLAEVLKTQDTLVRFGRELEEKYGPVAGQVLDRAAVQKALPAETAFLAWLDFKGQPKAADPNGEHWAVLLKAKGDPLWVRLPGSGPGNTWTAADDELPGKLRQALVRVGEWRGLARQLHGQRLAPLAGHLKGVRHLIVLPSGRLDGIPLEVLAEGFTVSYAPSASLFAHLQRQSRPRTAGLVALGDPVLQRPEEPEPPLPSGGLLLSAVPPGSPAARSGLRPGDVLLSYGDTPLTTLADLQKAIGGTAKGARVKVWRLEGKAKAQELTLRVPAGKLGVLLARQPAPRALVAQRAGDRLLAARDATAWQPLPGTHSEVAALQKLFAADRPTILLGSAASATKLAELAADGTLGGARFVHLATHGEARADRPLASRLILAQDRLGEGQSGELSAEQVLSDWQLSAELVTLSACSSGLGKYEHGEGFVGFAQALLLTGARSVCLSRWSVNDHSTALLMERFYQNLLGQRKGLKGPLGKAAALAEAKQWLRNLSEKEAKGALAALPRGKVVSRRVLPGGSRPYAHPYFWAPFVLVGDPH